MNGDAPHLRSPQNTLTNPQQQHKKHKRNGFSNGAVIKVKDKKRDFSDVMIKKKKKSSSSPSPSFSSESAKWLFNNACFMKWRAEDVFSLVRDHPIPCVFAACMLFFMGVEYTLRMIPSAAPPFDLGFVATQQLHRLLSSRPVLNNILAGLNTVFVAMQTGYILWTWLIEGRPRATISALFMFTFRGILGYSTQLPLPEGFLGSGVDFPVGNVSFFLFYSGHVGASVIASLDMRRMHRLELAFMFDALNLLQVVRLLGTRGHYTIDLAVGVGAGMLFDSLAGKYEESKKKVSPTATNTTNGAFYTHKE